jgi:hypothetical protein
VVLWGVSVGSDFLWRVGVADEAVAPKKLASDAHTPKNLGATVTAGPTTDPSLSFGALLSVLSKRPRTAAAGSRITLSA